MKITVNFTRLLIFEGISYCNVNSFVTFQSLKHLFTSNRLFEIIHRNLFKIKKSFTDLKLGFGEFCILSNSIQVRLCLSIITIIYIYIEELKVIWFVILLHETILF